MLIMVLIITSVGLLFGIGSLLLFRYQCQLRIERQHELEKVYAVRSALNYIRASTVEHDIPAEGKSFIYTTDSGRRLPLLVKPVAQIFPVTITNANGSSYCHFNLNDGNFEASCTNVGCQCASHYNSFYDYEYGWEVHPTGNLLMRNRDKDGRPGLAFPDLGSEKGSRWWVNIGMRNTGSWLQEAYGRRYTFTPRYYVDGDVVKDTIRLCLIRDITNQTNRAGCQHGWPLSKRGERALVLEICPQHGDPNVENNALINLLEYEHNGTDLTIIPLYQWRNRPCQRQLGVQLAGDRASVFHVETDRSGGYNFLDGDESTPDELDPVPLKFFETYFAMAQTIAGKTYPGTNTVSGKLMTPEMRAVFEVEATSDRRPILSSSDDENSFRDFRVTPAWQFDVFLEHPECVTNRATVTQKVYASGKGRSIVYMTLTYDTHGTENKGFRKDEREEERKRNRR